MRGMFYEETLSESFTFPERFGSEALDMSGMFAYTTLPEVFTFPAGFGSNAIYMDNMFSCVTLPAITFPKGFAGNCADMSFMFSDSTLGGDIDWSDTQFENLKSMDAKDMFYKTKFNGNRVIVANEDIRQKFIEEGRAADEAVVVKGARNEMSYM
jgi:hypothetical protein